MAKKVQKLPCTFEIKVRFEVEKSFNVSAFSSDEAENKVLGNLETMSPIEVSAENPQVISVIELASFVNQ